MAFWPSAVSSPPIKMRSGCNKSSTAVPSAKNSGLERIWNCDPVSGIVQNTFDGFGCSHRQGRFLDHDFVVFGNFGNLPGAQFDVFQVGGHSLFLCRKFLVGVFTEIKIIWASSMAWSTSVEKTGFFPGFGNHFAETGFINGRYCLRLHHSMPQSC